MLSFSFTYPKSWFGQIMNVLQGSETYSEQLVNETEMPRENSLAHKSKLNISLDDLKTVSTALIHYRRTLKKKGEDIRAEGVARIDEQFFQLISELENRQSSLAA
jgi:hypothetical protein